MRVLRELAAEPGEAPRRGGRRGEGDGQRPRKIAEAVLQELGERLVGLGLALLFVVFTWVRRLRDPNERLALRASIPAYKWLVHAFLAWGTSMTAPHDLQVRSSSLA